MFSPGFIEKFKSIWKNDYQEELTDQEAIEVASGLLNLYEIISRPVLPARSENEQRN